MRFLFRILLVGVVVFCTLFVVCAFIEVIFHPFGTGPGDNDWVAMVPGAIAPFVMIATAIGGSHKSSVAVSEKVSSVPIPKSKPRDLSHLKAHKANLQEELHHEQQISELEQKLMAERRLREKYKKIALGDD